jgi:hypothetical protein
MLLLGGISRPERPLGLVAGCIGFSCVCGEGTIMVFIIRQGGRRGGLLVPGVPVEQPMENVVRCDAALFPHSKKPKWKSGLASCLFFYSSL